MSQRSLERSYLVSGRGNYTQATECEQCYFGNTDCMHCLTYNLIKLCIYDEACAVIKELCLDALIPTYSM